MIYSYQENQISGHLIIYALDSFNLVLSFLKAEAIRYFIVSLISSGSSSHVEGELVGIPKPMNDTVIGHNTINTLTPC